MVENSSEILRRGWVLGEKLGEGGNGTVYSAKRGAVVAAIKILKKSHWSNPQRISRFKDEIEAMKRCEQIPGVIPVLDSWVPPNPQKKDPPWFAMALATPLETVLPSTSNLSVVIELVRDIAAILAKMHAIGVSHRDVKPSNLFKYESIWSVGDFGLAHFADKSAKTEEGEKLGPAYYIAPEMLNDAVSSNGMSADVYSLAKTIWVLATGQNFPPPGQHRTSERSFTISAYVNDARASLLDRLLEVATSPSPETRPSMEQFQSELEAWLHPATRIVPLQSELDLSDFAPELEGRKVLLEDSQEFERKKVEESQNILRGLRESFRPFAQELELALQKAHFVYVDLTIDNFTWGFSVSGDVAFDPKVNWMTCGIAIGIVISVRLSYQPDGMVMIQSRIAARSRRSTSIDERELWNRQDSFLHGGSQEIVKLQEITSDIAQQFRPCVAAVIDQARSVSGTSGQA